MTLIDFLRNETEVSELCVIRRDNCIIATCWINDKELSYVPSEWRDKEVQMAERGFFPVLFLPVFVGSPETEIPCRYIYV